MKDHVFRLLKFGATHIFVNFV